MRIMAAHAVASALRMVRVNILVTAGTRGGRRRKHVMRGVAAGAAVVGRDVARADQVDLRVAVAAGRGFLLFESMRLVATRAGRVPPLEKRSRRDDRLLFRVTGAAGLECVLRGRVTFLVTSGARFDQ